MKVTATREIKMKRSAVMRASLRKRVRLKKTWALPEKFTVRNKNNNKIFFRKNMEVVMVQELSRRITKEAV
jgi:hypothetical protein